MECGWSNGTLPSLFLHIPPNPLTLCLKISALIAPLYAVLQILTSTAPPTGGKVSDSGCAHQSKAVKCSASYFQGLCVKFCVNWELFLCGLVRWGGAGIIYFYSTHSNAESTRVTWWRTIRTRRIGTELFSCAHQPVQNLGNTQHRGSANHFNVFCFPFCMGSLKITCDVFWSMCVVFSNISVSAVLNMWDVVIGTTDTNRRTNQPTTLCSQTGVSGFIAFCQCRVSPLEGAINIWGRSRGGTRRGRHTDHFLYFLQYWHPSHSHILTFAKPDLLGNKSRPYLISQAGVLREVGGLLSYMRSGL